MAVWEEIVDYTVPSNTTSVDFTGLNITKDDFIKITCTFVNNGSSYPRIRLFPNGNTTESNYWSQRITANGSSVLAARLNTNVINLPFPNNMSPNFTYIKLSENDKYNHFSNFFLQSNSNIQMESYYTTSTSSFTNGITSLTFLSSVSNNIFANSRIQIYRLTAEKVADITVASNTTQVDITGLNIDKGSEYLLVSDIVGFSGIGQLMVNNNTTSSNYYSQWIAGNGSVTATARRNDAFYLEGGGNGRDVGITHIKLSNIGAYTSQTQGLIRSGTSSIFVENQFVSSTAENITSINTLNIVLSSNMTSTSRFQLYKLY